MKLFFIYFQHFLFFNHSISSNHINPIKNFKTNMGFMISDDKDKNYEL